MAAVGHAPRAAELGNCRGGFALILLTQLRLMGELKPFALAFWAAAGRNERRRMAVYGAVMWRSAVDRRCFYALELGRQFSLLCNQFTYREGPQPKVAILAAALLIGAIPRLWSHIFSPMKFLIVLEVILAVLAAVVFCRSLPVRRPTFILNVILKRLLPG